VCVPSIPSIYLFLFLLTEHYCSKNIAADPARYGKINHKYAATTGISNLRYHLENHHSEEYVECCADNNWTMMLPR
jgi:hypothetical protein